MTKAGKVVAAFEEAQTKGLGATSFEGEMTDPMSYKQAKNLIGFEIIADEEAKRQQTTAVSLSQFFASIQ